MRLKKYVVSGIRDRFRIGFDYHNHSCKRAKKNMSLALDHPEIVNILQKSVQQEDSLAPSTQLLYHQCKQVVSG